MASEIEPERNAKVTRLLHAAFNQTELAYLMAQPTFTTSLAKVTGDMDEDYMRLCFVGEGLLAARNDYPAGQKLRRNPPEAQ